MALNHEISRDRLQKIAPSVFATSPWSGVSAKYRFIPTIEIVDSLADDGFVPVMAMQSKTRIPGKGDFTKHMLRLRRRDDLTRGGDIPEILLVNSHDRASAWWLSLGIFRTICTNGLVVKSADFGEIRVRHQGNEDFTKQIIDASYEVIDNGQKVMASIDTWKQIQLSLPEKVAFAKVTTEKVLGKPEIQPERMLRTHRYEDRQDDSLWTTFNVVQENAMKGGVSAVSPNTGRVRRTQAVRSVDKNIKINEALWSLGEEMAKLKNA